MLSYENHEKMLLDKKLLEQSEFEEKIAEHNFIMLQCKKCINTPLMKKRDCDLLYGYREPDCKLMDKFVEEKTKGVNTMILQKAFVDLMKAHKKTQAHKK